MLDILDIDLLSPVPKISQPENWLIGQERWLAIGQGAICDVLPFVATDPELFRGYDRFVAAADIQAQPPHSSLALVSPQNLVWLADQTHYGKRRMLGTFSLSGQSYTLPLTDDFHERQLAFIEMHKTSRHDPSKPILLTLSLGDLWKETNRHYKLIAGVVT